EARALDVGERRRRADLERLAIEPDPGQGGQPVQRDQPVRLHQTETDHGHEGRAAGDDARLAVEPGDGVERFAQGLGLEETEGMQSHRYFEPGAAASTASTIFVYPVQRHRLPDSASRTSSIVCSGWSGRSAFGEL